MKTYFLEDSPQSNLAFTFQQHQNQLIITAQSEDITYQSTFPLNPDINSDEVIRLFESRMFEIVSKSIELLKLKFGFHIMEFKNKDKIDLELLKGNVVKLMQKLEEQLAKNMELQTFVRKLKDEVDWLTQNHTRLEKKYFDLEQQNTQLKQQVTNCNKKIENFGKDFDKRLNKLQSNQGDRKEQHQKKTFSEFYKH